MCFSRHSPSLLSYRAQFFAKSCLKTEFLEFCFAESILGVLGQIKPVVAVFMEITYHFIY